MRVGLLGGSFDPIHLGHVAIAQEAIQNLGLDQFYFIPTKNNPWKNTTVATGEQRVKMIKLATSDYQMMDVEPIELNSVDEGKNYTIDTLQALTAQHPENEYFYLMGMDQACQFDKWVNAKEISELVQLVAFNRAGYQNNHENIKTYHFIKMDNTEMLASSTEIKAGNLTMLDKTVLKYISHHGLYIDTMIKPRLSTQRYEHTLSVAQLTSQFCKANGESGLKGYIAGIMHDVAKELPYEVALELMEKYYPKYMNKPRQIWHQWLSSYICQKDFLIDDKEILKAIEDHTTASTFMSTLGKCLYCADKLDPLRGYDSSKDIELCLKDIDQGFAQQLINFYEFSKKKGRSIDDVFFDVYKTYVEEK